MLLTLAVKSGEVVIGGFLNLELLLHPHRCEDCQRSSCRPPISQRPLFLIRFLPSLHPRCSTLHRLASFLYGTKAYVKMHQLYQVKEKPPSIVIRSQIWQLRKLKPHH